MMAITIFLLVMLIVAVLVWALSLRKTDDERKVYHRVEAIICGISVLGIIILCIL